MQGSNAMNRSAFAALAALLATLAAAPPVSAHPHVYVDTRIGFIFGEGRTLEALEVSWRFDAYLTLYSLAEEDIAPNAEGGLDPAAAEHMARVYADWQPSFDGFAKLALDGAVVPLGRPEDFTARLVDGELEIAFRRALPEPAPLGSVRAEVAVYEETYYYAATVADEPTISGDADGCAATLNPYQPTSMLSALQSTLFDLGREETPSIESVGALFADRIELECE